MNGDGNWTESSEPCDCPDCVGFDEGDFVVSIDTPALSGVVVGERDWGRQYDVRLRGTVTIVTFFAVELRLDDPDDADDGDGDEAEPDAAVEPDNFTETNVINLAKRRMAGSA